MIGAIVDKVEFPAALWTMKSEDVGDESKSVVGLLNFDGEHQIELTVPFGLLLDWPCLPIEGGGYVQTHTIDGLSQDAIYGYSQTGKYLVLRDVASWGPSRAYPGFKKQTLWGSSLLVSREPMDGDPKVSIAHVELPGLREWMGKISFEATSQYENGRAKETSFAFRPEEMQAISLLENDEMRVSVECCGARKGGKTPSYTFEFELDCFLSVELLGESVDIGSFLDERMYPVVEFLSFCMGFRYAITGMEFFTSDGQRIEYYAPFVGVRGLPSGRQINTMPFPYERVEDQILTMLGSWVHFDSYARNASKLIVSLMNNWEMPLDMLFLASAQAFEAMTRVGVGEQEITDEELDKRLEVINCSNMPARTKGWAVRKLKGAKWKTANQLADVLLVKLKPIVEYVIPDAEKFKRDHRIQRNAFTHRRGLAECEKLTNEQLYYHTQAVQLLAYAAIAVEMGLTAEEVRRLLEKSRFRDGAAIRVRKLYAHEAKPVSGKDGEGNRDI